MGIQLTGPSKIKAGVNSIQQAEEIADAIQAGNPTLTREQAAARAWETPGLYEKYLSENPAQVGSARHVPAPIQG